MASKTRQRGSGITANEIEICSPADPEFSSFWGRNCQGWNKMIEETGSIFGAVSYGAAKTCEDILASTGNEAPFVEDAPEAFSEDIINHISDAQLLIKEGSADSAAVNAWKAGVLWGRASMKWDWEEDAIRGQKVAGGEKNSAHQTNQKHVMLREQRFRRMSELVPIHGVDKAAAHCASDPELARGASAEAIKRQYNRYVAKK